jgi:transcriptional regulator with XRE-family HTH domain
VLQSDGAKAITPEVAEDRLKGVTVPSLRHDDVRNELLSDLSDAGRRQYEAFGAVQEARHVTVRLAELREAANLSQRQAAKLAGVDQADLSRIESGQVTPSLPTLLRLLEVVGGTLIVAGKRATPTPPEEPGRSAARRTKGPRATTESTRRPRKVERVPARAVSAAGKTVRRSA